ncbi:cysteine hydrolase family protein [Nannocystis pusilla]|uniref:cysteine hydrolase family protein n=1 Tax=Nannocystis pusilla TaxID=889268 RepID=UPI003B796820
MQKKIHLLIIDPQRDFCDPSGSLFVPGADRDMLRLARFIERMKQKLRDIHVTLDSHRRVDISHPMWWVDSSGKNPAPFTRITPEDVRAGKWTTRMPALYKRSLAYLDALRAGSRYEHTVWPYHCLIGDEGAAIVEPVSTAIHRWEERFAQADFITKGSNMWTEHFSGVQAEVPDSEDPSTQMNMRLIETLQEADVVLLAGEALSHCLANTGRDIIRVFNNPTLTGKLHLLRDATSSVGGFEALGDAFIHEFEAAGGHVTTTQQFMAAA